MKRYVIMGVAGCGKSSIGAVLGAQIGAQYIDGDDLHPKQNIEKMSRGEPLQDADRWPWLARVGEALATAHQDVIVGCSALKRSYRDFIRDRADGVVFIHLAGSREVIAKRMAERDGHFMPTSLLDSQFEALQVPGPDEPHIAVDISGTPEDIVEAIIEKLARREVPPSI